MREKMHIIESEIEGRVLPSAGGEKRKAGKFETGLPAVYVITQANELDFSSLQTDTRKGD